MALSVGIGVVQDLKDSYKAGSDAARQALADAGVPRAQLAVLLASSVYNQDELLKGVNDTLAGTPIVGCTTAGIITSDQVSENAVAVMTLAGEKIRLLPPIKIENISKDMRIAGKSFGEKLKEASQEDIKMAFIFSDALSGNGTQLVRGVLDVMGSKFILAGGAAADDMKFKKTYQYWNNEVLTDAAVGFGIGGEMAFTSAADHGWLPMSDPRTVTKAEGTTLIELDGKPAFSIYKEYFEDRANDIKQALSIMAITYPLGMKVRGVDQYMIRVPLAIKEDGAIVCGAEVLEGSQISLMIGSRESAMAAADKTIRAVTETLPGRKQVVFISDCVARKILFGPTQEEELSLLKRVAGANTKIFGFYSYGQVAPLDKPTSDVNTCDPWFYEQSISLTAFGE